MTKKLSTVEDSSVVRDYIENQLISMERRFRKEQFDYKDEMSLQFNVLKEQNLLVPGLVGRGESFENLKGWILYMNTHIQHTFTDMEGRFYEKLGREMGANNSSHKETLE